MGNRIMKKPINLEEILDTYIGFSSSPPFPRHFYIEAMREACRQSLELAAENATIDPIGHKKEEDGIVWLNKATTKVCKQSIINIINLIK